MSDTLVSFGLDVRRPQELQGVGLSAVLSDIETGRWRALVESVRSGNENKTEMPYFTPAGLFQRRSNAGLLKHSGHVAIDLDRIGARGATRAIQVAVADNFCRFAFRSVSGKGVRLGFACPPCSAEEHTKVFHRVADHVRRRYGIDPDTSGSDVSRASFVSFDRGLWLNRSARMLPGLRNVSLRCNEGHTGIRKSLCVPLNGGDVVTLPFGLGESGAPYQLKPDGTVYTHESLRDLARSLVVQFRRHALPLSLGDVECAFKAWWDTARRKKLHFRLGPESYRRELEKAIRCVERVPWIERVVNFWPRWTREPEFPSEASPRERLEWAVRRHCLESGQTKFFLAARDAATITGTNFRNANDTLHGLVAAGILKRVGRRKRARDAQTYKLVSSDPE
jgi:VirE-like protein